MRSSCGGEPAVVNRNGNMLREESCPSLYITTPPTHPRRTRDYIYSHEESSLQTFPERHLNSDETPKSYNTHTRSNAGRVTNTGQDANEEDENNLPWLSRRCGHPLPPSAPPTSAGIPIQASLQCPSIAQQQREQTFRGFYRYDTKRIVLPHDDEAAAYEMPGAAREGNDTKKLTKKWLAAWLYHPLAVVCIEKFLHCLQNLVRGSCRGPQLRQ